MRTRKEGRRRLCRWVNKWPRRASFCFGWSLCETVWSPKFTSTGRKHTQLVLVGPGFLKQWKNYIPLGFEGGRCGLSNSSGENIFISLLIFKTARQLERWDRCVCVRMPARTGVGRQCDWLRICSQTHCRYLLTTLFMQQQCSWSLLHHLTVRFALFSSCVHLKDSRH